METSNNVDLSFDIVKFLPEDICDNIFGNLKSRDVLEASLVSTEWNKFIGKSAICMQKLRLKFSAKELKETRHVKRVLMSTERQYENVAFDNLNLERNDVLAGMRNILLIRGRKWKQVTLTSLHFPTNLDFNNFITIVEPFVGELKIKDVKVLSWISSGYPKKRKLSEPQNKSLTFPNLKLLELDSCHLGCHESFGSYELNSWVARWVELLQDVVTLTEFKLRANVSRTWESSWESSWESTWAFISTPNKDAIQKLFLVNKGLQKFSASSIAFDRLICAEASTDITFKLTSLHILNSKLGYVPPTTTARMNTNLKQFLELHMNTLESLIVEDRIELETVKVAFHMPELKHLSLGVIPYWAQCKETSFNQSLSLLSLDLYPKYSSVETLRTFVVATPNLKKLQIYSINDEGLACFSELLPSLESLSVAWIEVLDVTDKSYFPNLKELSIERYACRSRESGVKENLFLSDLCFRHCGRNVEMLRAFFIVAPKARPNVKKLVLDSINDESIACISELLPRLESLSVTMFDVRDVTDKSYLPNLMELSFERYYRPIKESGENEDRSKLESLFLGQKKTAVATKT